MKQQLIAGTRKSALARWQTDFVIAELKRHHSSLEVQLQFVVTEGDRTQEANLSLPEIGGKGLFTEELEAALRRNEIDFAVHSLKDLPTAESDEFVLGAVLARVPVNDVLVSQENRPFRALPEGSLIGSSSGRRVAQLRRIRTDLLFGVIRGNVGTRIEKVRSGKYQATVLAQAGLLRLGYHNEWSEIFSLDDVLPAPGQGALAVQCRRDDVKVTELLRSIHDLRAAAATAAERSFLAGLGGGCNTPVAAYAVIDDSGTLRLRGRCLSEEGPECVEVSEGGPFEQAVDIGTRSADVALRRGADQILGKIPGIR